MAYWRGDEKAELQIESVLGTTSVPVDIYFRNMEEMPMAELYALQLAQGLVLEVGAGSGSHVLALQEMGLSVTALDIHPTLGTIMLERGAEKVVVEDYWAFQSMEKYDTLLFMMNGVGFVGSEKHLPAFFKQCDLLLAKGGQILFDSTDLSINVPGIHERNPNPDYWGEMTYRMAFAGEWGDTFSWLYLDPDRLQMHAEKAGFLSQIVYQGDDGHYLARLTRW